MNGDPGFIDSYPGIGLEEFNQHDLLTRRSVLNDRHDKFPRCKQVSRRLPRSARRIRLPDREDRNVPVQGGCRIGADTTAKAQQRRQAKQRSKYFHAWSESFSSDDPV
jgi:hypothetical protein